MIARLLPGILALGVAAAVGCATSESVGTFDSARSYRYLKDQVAFGPRVPGSEAWRQCREYYYKHFATLGLAIDSQAFSFLDPYSGVMVPLVNVIARVPGTNASEPGIVLMAHWDSRPRTDHHSDPARRSDPIMGANDGASGAAVLMELAHMLAAAKPPYTVDLVLTDGEDWGEEGDLDYYLLGSKHFAAQGIRETYRFGIVIDMIGDQDLSIYRDRYSEQCCQPLNDMIWDLAAKKGLAGFRDSIKYSIIDDHLSLVAGGVKAVVLIDFDYPYWHTEFDTPERCSPQSLESVGRLLAEIIYRPSLWPN